MRKSQLAGFIIDCHTDDLEAAGNFWGAALGLAPTRTDKPEDADYVMLDRGPEDLDIEVQKVGHPSRVHRDIETDAVEAEAARLEKLGARKLQKIRTWWVMEAPTGQRFCVVRVKRANFDEIANRWP